jgi:hypothetical protein
VHPIAAIRVLRPDDDTADDALLRGLQDLDADVLGKGG